MKLLYNVITSLFLLSSINAQSAGTLSLSDQLNNILADPYFETSTIAIDVFDLTAGESLFSHNENQLFRPASNLKLFTSAAALYFLGPKYKFKTSLYYAGEIADSVCYGDLYVVGGFDPEFTSDDLDSLVSSIKEFGVKEIRGNLYGDVSLMDSLHWGKGWMWDDDPYLFSPYLTPLSINKNGIKIVYEPGGIGSPANVTLIPQAEFYSLYNTSVTILEDSSDLTITRDYLNHSNDIIIKGTLSFHEEPDTTELNLYHPELYFLSLMREAIVNKGIVFKGIIETNTLPEDAVNLITIDRPYMEIIENLNRESDNLNAELVLRTLAYEYFGKPASAENGIKMIDSLITLTGLENNKFRIVDGSGLSFYNLVSARSITELLKYIYVEQNDLFKIFYNSLPIAGVDGALGKRMLNGPAYNNVHAKTGTLSGVSSLSGYLTTGDDHLISFSLIIQNYIGSSRKAKNFQDEICNILCGIKNEKL